MVYKFKVSAKRSNLMRKIRSNRTTPEVLLQKVLRKAKIKFKKNCSTVVGKPDIVFPAKKIAIFIDGEFWHGYNWEKKKSKIKNNRSYWIPKIEKNILRDQHNNRLLRKQGWRVIRFWQQQIVGNPLKCIQIIKKIMQQKLR